MGRELYQDGIAGVKQSLSAMVRQIRVDRGKKSVKGWAQNALGAAGIDGRDHPSIRSQAQALLDALRKGTRYHFDPVGLEFVANTEAILCFTKEDCLGGGDCDDLTVAFCSAAASIGINVCIFLQTFGEPGQHQQHVLAGVQDESGEWLRCDPTLKDAPVGQGAAGVTREEMIDPFEALAIQGGGVAAAKPEIVTFGRVPHPNMKLFNGKWWWWDGNQWLMHHEGQWQAHGVAALPKEVGVGPGRGCGGSCKTAVGFSGCTQCGVGAACESCFKFHSVGVGAICNTELLAAIKDRVIGLWQTLDLMLIATPDDDLKKRPIPSCKDRFTIINEAKYKSDYHQMRSWYDESFPLCFADIEIAQGREWEKRADAWRVFIEKMCGPSDLPKPPAIPSTDPRSPDYKEEDSQDKALSTVKTIAVAGAVIVGGVVLIWAGSQVVSAVKAGTGLLPARKAAPAAPRTATPRRRLRARRPYR